MAGVLLAGAVQLFVFAQTAAPADDRFVSYTVDPQKQGIKLYWRDEQQVAFKSIGNLKNWLDGKHETLVFAMNGGMYMEDRSPLGLYVEQGKTVRGINTSKGNGNFYLEPNGVFFLTADNVPGICPTATYKNQGKIKYATQSGPMLVIDGQIHPAFKEGSANLNIRNGVGILPGNQVVFAMSKEPINFYDFATYFKRLGCKDALYLDGFVSRMYLPSRNWVQTDGDFGVIVGVTENQ